MPSHPLSLQHGWPNIRSVEYENQQNHANNFTIWQPASLSKRGAATKLGSKIGVMQVGGYVFLMILLIFIFCRNICLTIHFGISKDGLALYVTYKKSFFCSPANSGEFSTHTSMNMHMYKQEGKYVSMPTYIFRRMCAHT